MVVADLPTPRVWQAALRALDGLPIDHAADGLIRTGWRERPPTAGEVGLERVVERFTVHVEPLADRITRVRVLVEAQGWRAGAWVILPDTDVIAGEVLERIRAAVHE
jgi:hypothetical protein